MEYQLTEFIALACYTARRLLGASEVPQGVIEKTLHIAEKVFGIRIDFHETRIRQRGSQSALHLQRVATDRPPLDLVRLESKYFAMRHGQAGVVYSHTPEFDAAFAALSEKAYFPSFERVITEVLPLWKRPGGLENLLYISLFAENSLGMQQLVGDIEIATNIIYDYARKYAYLRRPDSLSEDTKARKTLQDGVSDVLSALRSKCRILKSSSSFHKTLCECAPSVGRAQILKKVRTLDEHNGLVALVEWLSAKTNKMGQLLSQCPLYWEANLLESGPPDVEPVMHEVCKVESHVRYLWDKRETSCSGTIESRITHATNSFVSSIDRWNRALLGYHDQRYFSAPPQGYSLCFGSCFER